jgi:hypothetical protein
VASGRPPRAVPLLPRGRVLAGDRVCSGAMAAWGVEARPSLVRPENAELGHEPASTACCFHRFGAGRGIPRWQSVGDGRDRRWRRPHRHLVVRPFARFQGTVGRQWVEVPVGVWAQASLVSWHNYGQLRNQGRCAAHIHLSCAYVVHPNSQTPTCSSLSWGASWSLDGKLLVIGGGRMDDTQQTHVFENRVFVLEEAGQE